MDLFGEFLGVFYLLLTFWDSNKYLVPVGPGVQGTICWTYQSSQIFIVDPKGQQKIEDREILVV